MIKTLTIQIGNSDDKLKQAQWCGYVRETKLCIERWATSIYFFGGSSTWEMWQNVCWVISCREDKIEVLQDEIADIRTKYHQESVALTIGDTVMI